MEVTTTPTFQRKFKKVNPNIQLALESAVEEIVRAPHIGVLKTGDLTSFRVHKFKVNRIQLLIAYIYYSPNKVELIDFGSHENFYRDLKRRRS